MKMKKMQSVMTVRLPEKDVKMVEQISFEEKTDKSKTIRELFDLGRIYFAILKYKEGKVSIGKAAKIADLSISEMMDLLANLGIKSSLDVMDYKEGLKNLKEIFI